MSLPKVRNSTHALQPTRSNWSSKDITVIITYSFTLSNTRHRPFSLLYDYRSIANPRTPHSVSFPLHLMFSRSRILSIIGYCTEYIFAFLFGYCKKERGSLEVKFVAPGLAEDLKDCDSPRQADWHYIVAFLRIRCCDWSITL